MSEIPRAELSAGYRGFFSSKAGENLIQEINRLRKENYESAENNPELSRDHVQRAKGQGEVLEHILGLLTEGKKVR